MSYRYLGATLDIHGGGQDLIFPHHENEIAQSECYSGVKPFVRYWMHNGWLTLDEEKMSKSLGNIITIRDALDRYGADALRIFVLTAHYRAPLNYAEDSLEAGKRAAERLRLAATLPGGELECRIEPDAYQRRFTEAIDDDLNTAGALATLFDLSREINRARDEGRSVEAGQQALRELGGVLGLTLKEPAADFAAAPFIELLVELRKELRSRKVFDVADGIRTRLEELGIALEDGAEGTRWRRRD